MEWQCPESKIFGQWNEGHATLHCLLLSSSTPRKMGQRAFPGLPLYKKKRCEIPYNGPIYSPVGHVTITCDSKSHHSTGPISNNSDPSSSCLQQKLIFRLVNYNYSQYSAALQNWLYCASYSFILATVSPFSAQCPTQSRGNLPYYRLYRRLEAGASLSSRLLMETNWDVYQLDSTYCKI